MLPSKNIVLVNLIICMNRKCKLVTSTIRSKKQQMVERHIKLLKVFV